MIIIAEQLHLKNRLNIECDLTHSRPEEQHTVWEINQYSAETRTLLQRQEEPQNHKHPH